MKFTGSLSCIISRKRYIYYLVFIFSVSEYKMSYPYPEWISNTLTSHIVRFNSIQLIYWLIYISLSNWNNWSWEWDWLEKAQLLSHSKNTTQSHQVHSFLLWCTRGGHFNYRHLLGLDPTAAIEITPRPKKMDCRPSLNPCFVNIRCRCTIKGLKYKQKNMSVSFMPCTSCRITWFPTLTTLKLVFFLFSFLFATSVSCLCRISNQFSPPLRNN